MSKINWLRWASALTFQLLALGIAANLVYSAMSGALDVRNEWEEKNTQEYNQTNKAASEIAERCSDVALPTERVADCLSAEINHYVNENNSHQDLQAQADMAYWAQALFWLSCFGAVISVLGLWAVFSSLRQTRVAISDTRDIGEKQVRAYINPVAGDDAINIIGFQIGERPEFGFSFRNSGNSPALNVKYAAGVEIDEYNFPTHNNDLITPVSDGPIPSDNVAPSDTSNGSANASFVLNEGLMGILATTPATKAIYLIGVVIYDDVFGNSHKTRFCYRAEIQLIRDPKRGEGITISWMKTAYHNDAD